jgi:hypothetical protein
MRSLITSTLQYVWPILDPAGEAPLTRAEILQLAYPALEDAAEEHGCTFAGPPLWSIQPGRFTKGWETWTGRVVIALVPVEHHPIANEAGEPLFTRAQWEEVHAAEQVQAELERIARIEAERIAREQLDAKVARLHAAGLSNAEITRVVLPADQQNDETIRRSLARQGLKSNYVHRDKRRHKLSTCLTPPDELITEWHGKSLTIAEIARACNFTVGVITVAFERLGLNPPALRTPTTVEPLPADDNLVTVPA